MGRRIPGVTINTENRCCCAETALGRTVCLVNPVRSGVFWRDDLGITQRRGGARRRKICKIRSCQALFERAASKRPAAGGGPAHPWPAILRLERRRCRLPHRGCKVAVLATLL